MGFMQGALDQLARRATGRATQQGQQGQAQRDVHRQPLTFSVESTVSDTLANLACAGFAMPVSGSSERALMLDEVSTDFAREGLPSAMSMGFATGDALVVPMWEGSGFVNAVLGRDQWRVVSQTGGRLRSVAYVADELRERNTTWHLLQVVSLEGYRSQGGEDLRGCHYTLRVARNGRLTDDDPGKFPEWDGYDPDWWVPDVDRLLVGRFRNFTRDKLHPNGTYGVPVCYGCSQMVAEVHYLLDQMHQEFALSEKAVMASKDLFAKDSSGALVLPRGKDRLFMSVRGSSVGESTIREWAPTIQAQPYMEALEVCKREIESAIGVDSGILSTPEGYNYQNVDNVRKSMRKTQSFVDHARAVADGMLDDLAYSWDRILSSQGHAPGEYDVQHKWSDEYINTFTDMREALVAGYGIGAMDSYDYRLFVLGEAPEVARQRVEEIRANRLVSLDA